MKSKISVIFLAFSMSAAAQQDAAVCTAMVEQAAHNIGITTNSQQYYQVLFDSYCENDGSTKQSGFNVGITLPISGIPIGLSGGATDNETKVKNFCKNFATTNQGSSSSFTYQSQVVASAVEAANQCLQVVKGGGSVVHHFGTPEVVAIDIAVGSGHAVSIAGLHHDPSVTCVGTSANTTPITFDDSTHLVLSADQANYTISCTRPATDEGAGRQMYKAQFLSLTTNITPYHVYWPQSEVVPLKEADAINLRLSAVESQLAQVAHVEADLTGQLNLTKNLLQQPSSPGKNAMFISGRDQSYTCPDGQVMTAINFATSGPAVGQGDAFGLRTVGIFCKKIF